MVRRKNGRKYGLKFNEQRREKLQGRKKQKFGVSMEGMWFDQMLPVSEPLPERMHQMNTSSFEPTNFEISHCENPEVFEKSGNTRTQNPPHPTKACKIEKRKHRANKRKNSQDNEKIHEAASLTIAGQRPFNLCVLPFNTTSTANLPIEHTQRRKIKLRGQSKRQGEDIQRKRDSVPTDSHLENSNNSVIQKWICQKNEVLKKEREAKRKQRGLEKAAHKRREIDQQKKQKESEEKVKMWMMKKGIIRTQKVNNCTVSLDANASAQNQKTSIAIIDMARKSGCQSPSTTLKSERQVTGEKLEVKQKSLFVLGTRKSKSRILSSKDQMVSLCKMMSTLVHGSQRGSFVTQKSNRKTPQKNKSVHQEFNKKTLSISTPFKVVKKSSMSSEDTSQVKELDTDIRKRRKHLLYQLQFHESLSRKAEEFQKIQVKMEEQETKLNKHLQNVQSKFLNEQTPRVMINKKTVTMVNETHMSPNTVSKFADVIPNSKRLQEAMVTPAVKNWFVHRLEENTMYSVDSNSSVQDGNFTRRSNIIDLLCTENHLNQVKKD